MGAAFATAAASAAATAAAATDRRLEGARVNERGRLSVAWHVGARVRVWVHYMCTAHSQTGHSGI